MWHLYKNKQNKFEIAFISKNGRYIVGSKQGYSRRWDAVVRMTEVNRNLYFHDDTKKKPIIRSRFDCEYFDQSLLTKPYKP